MSTYKDSVFPLIREAVKKKVETTPLSAKMPAGARVQWGTHPRIQVARYSVDDGLNTTLTIMCAAPVVFTPGHTGTLRAKLETRVEPVRGPFGLVAQRLENQYVTTLLAALEVVSYSIEGLHRPSSQFVRAEPTRPVSALPRSRLLQRIFDDDQ